MKDKDFSARLSEIGHPETDELIHVYNLMIQQLRHERLLQAEKSSFLGKLIEASPSGIIIFDFDGLISAINPAAASIFDMKPDEVLRKSLGQIGGRLAEELTMLEVNEAKVINLDGIKSYKCHSATFTDLGYSRAFITIEELTSEIYLKEKMLTRR
ncbi:PAS domain-containing protein [Pedobacter steynii]